MSLPADTILRRRTDVRFRRVQDESVVIRQQAGEVLVLNTFGGRILELLDGSRSLAEVIAALGAEFEADEATLRSDVLRFAGEMKDAGLIEPAADR